MNNGDYLRDDIPGKAEELFRLVLFACTTLGVTVGLWMALVHEPLSRTTPLTWTYTLLFVAGWLWLIYAAAIWGACIVKYTDLGRRAAAPTLDDMRDHLKITPLFEARIWCGDDLRDDASELWVDDLLVEVPTHARLAMDVLPPLFTAVGILFTFIGLSDGLSQVDLADNTIDAIVGDMDKLLQGIKTAFHSSIFGVVLSGFALLTARWFGSRLENCAADLSNALAAAKRATHRQLLEESNNILAEMRELSKEHASKLGTLVSDLPANIAQALVPGFASMTNTLVPELQNINSSVSGFVEHTIAAQREVMDQMMGTFLASFDEKLTAQFGQLSIVLARTLRWHEETQELYAQLLGRLDESVTKHAVLIHSLDRVSAQQLEMQQLYDTAINTQSDLVQQMNSNIQKLDEGQHVLGERMGLLATSLAGLDKTADAFDVFEGRLGQQLTSLDGVLTRTIEWHDRSRSGLDELLTALSAQTSTQDSFAHTLQQSLATQTNLLQAQQVQLTAQTSFAEQQSVWVEALRGDLRQIAGSQRTLAEGFASLAHSTDELGKVADAFDVFDGRLGQQLTSLDEVLTRTLDWHDRSRSGLDELLTALSDQTSTQDSFAQTLRQSQDTQVNLLRAQKTQLETQTSLGEQQSVWVEALRGDLRQIAGSQRTLAEGFAALERSADDLGQVAGSFTSFGEALGTHLASLKPTLAQTLKWHIESQEGTSKLLHNLQLSTSAQSRLASAFDGAADLQASHLEAQRRITKRLANSAEGMERSHEALASASNELHHNLTANAALLTRTERHLGMITDETERVLGGAFEKFDEAASEVVDRFNGTMVHFGSRLDDLREVVDALLDVCTRIRDIVEPVEPEK